MATLVACEYPSSESIIALGLEDKRGKVILIYPDDVEGFEVNPPWVLPILEGVNLENIQDKLPEAVLRLVKSYFKEE